MGYREEAIETEQIINGLADLPAPIAGKIQLEAKRYIIARDLVTPYTLVFPTVGTCEVTSTILGTTTIIYVGVGNMFEGNLPANSLNYLRKISVVAPAGGTILSITGSTSASLILNEFFAFGGGSVGTVDTVRLVPKFYIFTGFAAGLTVNNITTMELTSGASTAFLNLGTTHITVNGNCGPIKISDNSFVTEATEYAIYLNPAMTTPTGSIVDNGIPFNFLAPGSLDQSALYWNFKNNIPWADSAYYGAMNFQNNALTTVITTINTPVKVNAVWLQGAYERFSFDSSGRLTYIGLQPITISATVVFSAQFALGASLRDMTGYIYKNGIKLSASLFKVSLTNNTGSFVCEDLFNLVTNDYVELWVENNSTTEDINVLNAQFLAIRSA